MTTKERWLPVPIPGYGGLYAVSDRGQVRSSCSGKHLRLGPHNGGYLLAHLYSQGRRCARTIHRLVALAFIPNPDGHPCINHLDGDKTNNRVSNLEWCTAKENHAHAWATGLMKATSNAVVAVSSDGTGFFFPSQIAAELHLRGKLTGGVSWALRKGRPIYKLNWSRV